MDRPVDPDEVQALARESSIVCRQNAKLRAQLAELQAAREQDSSAFRSAMEDRPSSNDLQAARASPRVVVSGPPAECRRDATEHSEADSENPSSFLAARPCLRL